MNNRNASALGILLALLLGVFSCAREEQAGGNSAESGNPELAGTLTLPDGTPAAGIYVWCVPENHNPLYPDSSAEIHSTVTDSTGHFRFEDLPEGAYVLDVYDSAAGLRLLVPHITVTEGQTPQVVSENLQPTGTLRIGIDAYADGVQGRIVIQGTRIVQRVVVRYGSVFVNGLPAGEMNEILFYADGVDSALSLGTGHVVVPGDTVTLQAAPIHFSRRIALSTLPDAGDLHDTLVGFPLSLRLDSSRMDFTVAAPDKGRLRVWNGDSTHELVFRVGYWSANEARAVLWVRLDTLLPADGTQSLILTWSEKDPVGLPPGISPLSGLDGFVAAWHMEEDSPVVSDAGTYGFHGQAFSVSAKQGVLGKGLWFNGRTSYVTVPGSASGLLDFNFNDTMTSSVWVRIDDPNTSRFVFGKGTYQYYLKYYHPNGWLFELDDDELYTRRHLYLIEQDSGWNGGVWEWLTVVQMGERVLFYKDGVLRDSSAQVGVAPDSVSRFRGSTFEIGRRLYPDGVSGQHFWGIIDELWVSERALSPEWIRLSHRNQKPEGYWP